MKVRTHLRVAYDKKRRTTSMVANVKPSAAPLTNGFKEPLPTVAFALDLEIPDVMFRRAEEVIATLTIPEGAAQIAAEVKLP